MELWSFLVNLFQPMGYETFFFFWKSDLIFGEFFCYKISPISDLIDLFSHISIVRRLSIDRTKWFKYQFYWRFFVILTIYLILLHCLFNAIWNLDYSVRYFLVNKLNIAINSVPKYDHMSETSKSSNPYWRNYILLKPSIFRTCIFWIDWNVLLWIL